MPYKTWDELFTPGTDQIATVSDLQTQLRASGILTQESSELNQVTVLLSVMQRCSDDMKERVSLRFQNKFQEPIAYYYSVYQRAIRRDSSIMFPNGFPNFGYISTLGNFIGYNNPVMTDDPQVFVYLGQPPNDRFSGSAYNGAYCVDSTPSNQLLYINKGTLTSNAWEVADDSVLPDFLINPVVLKRAYIYGSIYFLFEDRTTNDILGNIQNVALYDRQEERYKIKYEELMSRALSLLDVDVSNGGKMKSMDLRSQRKQYAMK